MRSSNAGQLPHGRKQGYYLKRKIIQAESTGVSATLYTITRNRDMLFVIMEQYKNAEKSNRFVTCGPEPMAILCTNQQLLDVETFCCDPYSFSIFGVDPALNLSAFSVIPIVFRNVLLEDSRTHRSPVIMGPMLVHYRKQFYTDVSSFFSTLIGLQPSIQAVGIDGENAFVDALSQNFPHASQLRCFRHLQQNEEQHLRDNQFPSGVVKEFIQDIFGHIKMRYLKLKWPGVKVEDIVVPKEVAT